MNGSAKRRRNFLRQCFIFISMSNIFHRRNQTKINISSYLDIYFHEIRIRLMYLIFSLFWTFSCSYHYSEEITQILSKPLRDAYYTKHIIHDIDTNINTNCAQITEAKPFHFIFTDLTEAFWTQWQVSWFITLYLFLPFFIYQLWLFIKPGLYNFEKIYLGILLLLSFTLAFLSISLAYGVLIPLICNFFNISWWEPVSIKLLISWLGNTMNEKNSDILFSFFDFKK